jgi:hypothetical protein
MRIPRDAALLFLCVLMPFTLSAQQPTPSQPGPQSAQTATILQQAIAAQTGGAPVTDVTLTGTITVTIGAYSGSGTITFVATAKGQGQSTITMPNGTRTEVRNISSGSPTLAVTGPDGVTYTVTTQSAQSPHPGWFFPAFVLASGLSSSSYASSYVGQETWNSVSAQHVAVWLLPSASLTVQPSQQIAEHDIYLDPSSMLPVGITFTAHPYDQASPNGTFITRRDNTVDAMEQVQFLDYRQVQGRPVAFHLHITMKAGLLLYIVSDVQLSSASFNTGATVAVPNSTSAN